MKQFSADLLIQANATLAEGPAWCHRRNKLVWVDIIEKQVHFLDVDARKDDFIQLDVMVGAACPIPESGDLMLATENGIGVLAGSSNSIEWIGDPESNKPDNRFNDGKFDPAGRFWAGTMRIDCQDSQEGALYRVGKDRTITKVLDGISLSNGLAWLGDKMFYVDTPTKRVDVFDFDVGSGEIRNRRPLIELGENAGHPDGLTVDESGNIWLAQWGAGMVGQYDSNSGQLKTSVQVSAANVSSVGIGPDKTCYVTSARLELPQDDESDLGGSIFSFRLNDCM